VGIGRNEMTIIQSFQDSDPVGYGAMADLQVFPEDRREKPSFPPGPGGWMFLNNAASTWDLLCHKAKKVAIYFALWRI
jgi:hypothetical protein